MYAAPGCTITLERHGFEVCGGCEATRQSRLRHYAERSETPFTCNCDGFRQGIPFWRWRSRDPEGWERARLAEPPLEAPSRA